LYFTVYAFYSCCMFYFYTQFDVKLCPFVILLGAIQLFIIFERVWTACSHIFDIFSVCRFCTLVRALKTTTWRKFDISKTYYRLAWISRYRSLSLRKLYQFRPAFATRHYFCTTALPLLSHTVYVPSRLTYVLESLKRGSTEPCTLICVLPWFMNLSK